MQTCIYLRKSRADKDNPNISEEEVLRRHEETLLTYAKVNDLNIIEIKKEVVSGESLSRRPEMLKLLEEIEENKYDAVLVMDFDRLGRGNMMEQGLIINAFKESNTKIITPNKIYDLEDDFDEEYLDISAFFARKELKMITRRLHRGRMKSLEEGNYIAACAPLGYDKNSNSLEINVEEAKTVKLIFNLYINKNLGFSKIAKYLKVNNFKTKNKTTKWDKTTIRNVIKNPVYMGKVVWRKREYKYNDNGKLTSKLLDESKWKIFTGKHKPIIAEEIFKKAELISKNRYIPRTKKDYELRNPLSYILKCKNCGCTMTLRTYKNRPNSIRCYNNCGNKSSYISIVEEKLIEDLYEELNISDYPFEYREDNYTNEITINDVIITNNKKELQNSFKKKERLYDLLEQNIYDKTTFLERMKIINNKIYNLEITIKKSEYRKNIVVNRINTSKKNSPKIKQYNEYIKTIYYYSTPKEKNDFLREIIEHVTYKKIKKGTDIDLELFLKI